MMIRRLAAFLPAALLLAACSHAPAGLRTGDLLFVEETAAADETSMDGAISAATGAVIHVAIVDRDPSGAVWVVDATRRRGVDRHPLDTFLTDFAGTRLQVGRLWDTTGVQAFVGRARSLCGRPYDDAFQPGDSALYCSELVRECYRLPDGSYLFEDAPMNFRNADGTYPVYWQEHFARLGIPVPQGVPGTNPDALSRSGRLLPLFTLSPASGRGRDGR